MQHRTSLHRSPPHANQRYASGSRSQKLDPAAKWMFSEEAGGVVTCTRVVIVETKGLRRKMFEATFSIRAST